MATDWRGAWTRSRATLYGVEQATNGVQNPPDLAPIAVSRRRYRFGDFEVDNLAGELTRAGEPVDASPRVLSAIALLVQNRHRVVGKEELVDHVWNGLVISDAALSQLMASVRRCLGDDGARQRWIRTYRARGFRFVGDISVVGRGERRVVSPASSTSFVGRANLLERLRAHFEELSSGRGRAVVIDGEAGIGKTRLALELALDADRRGFTVCHGRCVEAQGAPVLWPWVGVVRALGDSRGPEAMRDYLGGQASDVATLIPDALHWMDGVAPTRARDVGNPDDRFRLFDALALILKRAAIEQPLLIVIDDLHRADEASVRVFEQVAQRVDEAPILLVACRRPNGDATAGLEDELCEVCRSEVEFVALDGLSPSELSRLVEIQRGAAGAPYELKELYHRTNGNPFFALQLISLSEDQLGVAMGTGVPRGVRGILRYQLRSLSLSCRRLLSAAAVVGRDFSTFVASSAAELGDDDTMIALDEAVATGLVQSDAGRVGEHRFTHALVRDCLYEDLLPSVRVSLHRRVAEALDRLHGQTPDTLAALAHHSVQAASAGSVGQAASYCFLAAEQATRQRAHADAARHAEQGLAALSLAPSSAADRLPLLLHLGGALGRLGRLDRAQRAFADAGDAARLVHDPDAFAEAALGYATINESGVVDQARIEFLQEALQGLPDDPSVSRVALTSRLAAAQYYSGPLDDCRDLNREAVVMARRTDDPRALAAALRSHHFTLSGPDHLSERRATTEELIAIAPDCEDPLIELEAQACAIEDALALGSLPRLDAAIDAHVRISQRVREPYFEWYAEVYRGMRALLAGEPAEADQRAHTALTLGQRAQNDVAMQWFAAQVFFVRRAQGRLHELEPVVQQLAHDHPENPGWSSALALLYTDLERRVEAAAVLEQMQLTPLASIRRDINWLITGCNLAEAAAFLEDRRAAEAIERALAPYADQHVSIGLGVASGGAVVHYLGLLATTAGDTARARDLLEDALRRHEALEAPWWIERTRIALGRV